MARNQRIVPDILGHRRGPNPFGVLTHRQAARGGFERRRGKLLHNAVREPTRLIAQVLLEGMHYKTLASHRISRAWHYDELSLGLLGFPPDVHAGAEPQMRALRDQTRAGTDNLVNLSFTPPHLAQIPTPSLLIVRDRDAFVMYRHLPEPYQRIVVNGDGILHHDDRGGRFSRQKARMG